MNVLLVRHPAVAVAEGVCYGRSDVELAPGWDAWASELTALVGALGEQPLVVSSPLARCRRVAEAFGRPVRADERITELDFGAWEGVEWASLPRAELDAWAGDIANVAPGGGETVAEMYRRSARVLDELRAHGTSGAVLVTHSGPIRCLLARALGLGPDAVLRLRVDLGAVSAIRLGETRDVLEFSNRVPPLLPFEGFA